LQCEAGSVSGGDHRWFERSTGKERLVTGDTHIKMMMMMMTTMTMMTVVVMMVVVVVVMMMMLVVVVVMMMMLVVVVMMMMMMMIHMNHSLSQCYEFQLLTKMCDRCSAE